MRAPWSPARSGLSSAGSGSSVAAVTYAGVTRFDLVCGPRIELTARALARRWAEDRALSPAATQRLLAVVVTAAEHGLRHEPRGLTMVIAWIGLDLIRLDLRWQGVAGTARHRAGHPAGGGRDVPGTERALDVLAVEWGFRQGMDSAVHWIVLDSR